MAKLWQLIVGVAGAAGVMGFSSQATASGPAPNRPPVFVGYPYGQQIADFTKLGGNDYVFTRTVVDPDPGDVVTMRGFVEDSPFTFSFTPGNPAIFEVRATDLGSSAVGGYIVGFTAYDGPASYSIAGVNIVVIPEPAITAGLAAGTLLLRRPRRAAGEPAGGRTQPPLSSYVRKSAPRLAQGRFEKRTV